MLFLSPIWLFGLLPWAAWAAWLVWGRRPKSVVPFLDLWRGPIVGERKRRSMGMPPVALLAMIAAVLLAILAAAGPVAGRGHGARDVVVIVDRGITMSVGDRDDAGDRDGPGASSTAVNHNSGTTSAAIASILPATTSSVPGLSSHRYDAALVAVEDFLHRDFGEAKIDRIVVTEGSLQPTAVDDPEALAGAVRAALNRGDGPVIVVSDRKLAVDDPRVVQVVPESKINNVGIALLSVRADPKPAAMVRVRNLSSHRSATISIASGGQAISREVDLPGEGEDRDYFFDLPGAGDVVEATIRAGDVNGASVNAAVDLNQSAYAIRENAWPRVEATSALPAEVRRIIDVYARLRPPGEGSARIAVLSAEDVPPSEEPAAIIAVLGADPLHADLLDADLSHPVNPGHPTELSHPADLSGSPVVSAGILKIETIDWSAALRGAMVAPAPAGDWKAIVQAGNDPVVMVQTGPIRRVWIGFSSPTFARSVDFVVFWNAIFDFLNDGKPEYVSQSAGKLLGKWLRAQANPTAEIDVAASDSAGAGLIPGIYQRADGVRRAVIAPPMPMDLATPIEWRAKLQNLLQGEGKSKISLREPLILFAIGLICIALATWAVVRPPRH
jgi:hypothetical protein